MRGVSTIDRTVGRLARALCFVLAAINHAAATPVNSCALQSSQGTGPTTPETVRVTRITGPNSFVVADGREIRLAGVATPHRFALLPSPDEATGDIDVSDPAEPGSPEPDTADPIAASRSALGAWLLGQSVLVSPVTPAPDRYGRLRASVVRASDNLWVEAELVKQGLARVEPQRDDLSCARALEAIETAARDAGRGFWLLPEFAVVSATDPARERWTGHYALIEGDIVSLRTSGTRHYMNFGRNFSRDFAVLLVDKGGMAARGKTPLASRFRAAGFEAPDIAGKRIRVRGILLRGGGGLIVPSIPEEIEWVEKQD